MVKESLLFSFSIARGYRISPPSLIYESAELSDTPYYTRTDTT